VKVLLQRIRAKLRLCHAEGGFDAGALVLVPSKGIEIESKQLCPRTKTASFFPLKQQKHEDGDPIDKR
jgi:hypothetical protein